VFILGDLRQAGRAMPTVSSMRFRFCGTVMLELFSPAPHEFLQQMPTLCANLTLEVSAGESRPRCAARLRQALRQRGNRTNTGRRPRVGARRLDVFFMIGCPSKRRIQSWEPSTTGEEPAGRFGKDAAWLVHLTACAFLDLAAGVRKPGRARLPPVRAHPGGASGGACRTKLEVCA